ncbi:hypothetical protein MHM582_3603, partial [Microbacterium sp. HM58-2]
MDRAEIVPPADARIRAAAASVARAVTPVMVRRAVMVALRVVRVDTPAM